jgi:carboxyl-terminal processing protease
MENPSTLLHGGQHVFLEGQEMIRKLSLLFAGALMGASAMSLVYGAPSSSANAAGSETYRQLAIFGDIFERVRGQYVTPPDDKALVENAINGMLTSLDPHSSYLNPEAAKDMRVQTKGEFGGLGIEVTMENELVKVITPIDDTPAARAGVRAGDFIAEIDGEEVRGLTLNDAVEKMRGLVNTPIELTIVREGTDKPIKLTIVRDIIKVKAVKYRVENDVGYMKITSFTEKTFDDLQAAIDDIKSKIPNDKLKGYVLDLRLNPGGLLDQAVSVSDTFLDRGEIVSTRGRDPKDISRFDSRPGDLVDGKPMIVLVNGGSASASEIVAGALQDHRRATVLGTQSFGKGSVQTIIPLAENGALRLTTALYYTPAGKSIQGKGITPDIKVEQPLPEELKDRDITRGESDLKGHIKGAEEGDQGSGSAAYVPPEAKDDIQLNYALDLLRGTKTDPAFPPNPQKAVLNQQQ